MKYITKSSEASCCRSTSTGSRSVSASTFETPGCENGIGISSTSAKRCANPTGRSKQARTNGKSSYGRKERRSWSLSMMRKPRKSLSLREPKVRRYQRCPVCGKGELVPVDDIVSEMDGYTFVERGRRCTVCGEEFISEDESQRMIKVARRLGLWGEP